MYTGNYQERGSVSIINFIYWVLSQKPRNTRTVSGTMTSTTKRRDGERQKKRGTQYRDLLSFKRKTTQRGLSFFITIHTYRTGRDLVKWLWGWLYYNRNFEWSPCVVVGGFSTVLPTMWHYFKKKGGCTFNCHKGTSGELRQRSPPETRSEFQVSFRWPYRLVSLGSDESFWKNDTSITICLTN